MKILVAAALVVVAALAYAGPAAAFVVAVTTTVPASTVANDTDFKDALAKAIDDVLTHAIAFRPAFVRVQATNLVGGRLYIMLLIADREGEDAMNQVASDPGGPPSGGIEPD